MLDTTARPDPDWTLVAEGPEPTALFVDVLDDPDDDLLFDPYTLPEEPDVG